MLNPVFRLIDEDVGTESTSHIVLLLICFIYCMQQEMKQSPMRAHIQLQESIVSFLSCLGSRSGRPLMHQDGEQTSAQGTSQRSTISDRLSLGCTSTAKERMDVVVEGTLGNIQLGVTLPPIYCCLWCEFASLKKRQKPGDKFLDVWVPEAKQMLGCVGAYVCPCVCLSFVWALHATGPVRIIYS